MEHLVLEEPAPLLVRRDLLDLEDGRLVGEVEGRKTGGWVGKSPEPMGGRRAGWLDESWMGGDELSKGTRGEDEEIP